MSKDSSRCADLVKENAKLQRDRHAAEREVENAISAIDQVDRLLPDLP